MSQPTVQSFAEKHGGFVISLAFHAAFLMVLQNATVPASRRAPEKPPEPIRIELNPVEEVEEMAVATPTPLPEWSENVATTAEAHDGEESVTPEGEADEGGAQEEVQLTSLPSAAMALNPDPLAYVPAPSPQSLPEPDLLIQEEEPELQNDMDREDEEPPLLMDERIRDFLAKREKALKEYNEVVGERGSDRVAQQLSLARAELEGKRWLETTEGGQEGAIRSFTSEGVSPKIAEEVYARYGIESFSQYVDVANGDGYNYLNSAKVGGKQYTRREGRGVFRVLSIPQGAYGHLARLERDALVQRGLDPAKTRILEVEFGITPAGKTYDLTVTRIKVAPIEFQP